MGMNAGHRGTFVITWAQTEIDSIRGAPLSTLTVGAQWRWWGEAARIDGPGDMLVLDGALGVSELRRHAARSVGRFLRMAGMQPDRAMPHPVIDQIATSDLVLHQGFSVTDGQASYGLTVAKAGDGNLLLLFTGRVPPMGTDLFVVDHTADGLVAANEAEPAGGVICFTPGTRIDTPDGQRLIEDIRPGDRINTKDDGAQEVIWTGQRRMTGARLHAMPHLRPIRIRAGAMGEDRPEHDLLVSPQHRMLIKSAPSLSLFNQPEVLIAASDLVDGNMILTDTALREVTYIHLMTERHQIVWANGLETESFHPANADLNMVDPVQRSALLDLLPCVAADPYSYGDFARRSLTAPEAAILRHEAA